MYPRTYYETFMRYEASNEVFVAMPFTEPFQQVFTSVIAPAIARVSVNGKPLAARVVNRGTSGAPDIHEKIFDAILHARLVVADMTVQASYVADGNRTRWQANSNVAYEVGLAAAWRNPEDVLLLHQPHKEHSYSFDVQNLRHFEYDPTKPDCAASIASEIVNAINQSAFLSRLSYQTLLESVSPSAVQYMHQEVQRAFPVVAFQDTGMPIMDARIHAATELLQTGALKNRNVIPQPGKGVAVIYEWTELGMRMLESLHAATGARRKEIATQIASVPPGTIPPQQLRTFPAAPATSPPHVNMAEAVKMETDSPVAGAGPEPPVSA